MVIPHPDVDERFRVDAQTVQSPGGVLVGPDIRVGSDEVVVNDGEIPSLTLQDAHEVGDVAQLVRHLVGEAPDALPANVDLLRLELGPAEQVDRYVSFHVQSRTSCS